MSGTNQPKGTTDTTGVDLGAASGKRVVLDSVRKSFDDIEAVRGVSLEIEPGELVVLLGPSGCGKTTTLRMIAGLETVTDGSIAIGGEDVTQTLPQERDISMVFQNYALYPHKTVRENLLFPLGKLDITDEEREQRVRRVAEVLEVEELLDKMPDQLSGGQRQRIAVGRTIIREPVLFLMDEPLSNLDAELRVSTRSELRNLQQELGTTTVYVTHDQEEAMSIADRVVIMNDGEIQQVGTPKEVYTRPRNAFVAEFLGDPSINFLPVERRDGAIRTVGETTIEFDFDVADGTDVERIGVRPQDVRVGDAVTDGGHASMRLDTVDPLGHVYEIVLNDGNRTYTALVDDPGGSVGDTVPVAFDREDVYVFDTDGETVEVNR